MENIFTNFLAVFRLGNLIILSLGTFIGIIFGALPGFTAGMGIAVLIPLTFNMDALTGLLLLAGVYNGAIYGGSISAILLHTPGTPAAAATAIDGFALTQKGQSDIALSMAVTASAFGGIVSTIVLLFVAPPLAELSLKFGPPEFFLLAIFGLTIIASLSEGGFLKGAISGIIGLLVATIGLDPIYAFQRFTFNNSNLLDGVSYVPALIGLFAISQVFIMSETREDLFIKGDITVNRRKRIFVFPNTKPLIKTFIRSSIIGTFIGMLPGAGTSIASFLGYNEAKRASKYPERFGKGEIEGVAAAEVANNAVTGGSLIPLLTLGIPGNSVTAILLGGLMIQGLRPGYELFTVFSHITYPFIWGLMLSNVIMFFMGTFLSYFFAKIIKLKKSVLIVGISVFAIIGTYAINNNIFDLWVALIFGIAGYILRKTGFNVVAVVLGIILGPIAEAGIKRSLVITGNSFIRLFFYMINRPICLVMIALILLSIITQFIRERKMLKK